MDTGIEQAPCMSDMQGADFCDYGTGFHVTVPP